MIDLEKIWSSTSCQCSDVTYRVFAINHLFIFKISTFPFSSKSGKVLEVKNKLVSSANILIFPPGTELGISFMNIRNKSGPNTEPWGTPHVTGKLVES